MALLFPTDNDTDLAALAANAALAPRAGHYDELRAELSVDGGTLLRAPWRQFFQMLGAEGLAELDDRAEAVAHQIRENGVTYNIYADADGPARPWSLDLLPFIIEADDWARIERGVAQRARLLNQMLADVYGPQTLLQQGLLPPALVQGHPGYLRPLRGYTPPGGVYLHLVAFDLARASDGAWQVVSQRTQAPSGLGYLLENRLIISGLFPEAYKELRVQHIAASYRRLVSMLYRLMPGDLPANTPPRIALLTPGPYNETYFEQVYLARYLGLTLVEGNDLLVRDQQLYLKTLHGLERVHALLRRLDDDFCDPLELRADSALGVPGLLQAMRAGNVLVANALGTSLLESPAIHGFLPPISQHLLGEPLLLPSLPSWWCGEAAARQQALPMLDSAVIKATYSGSRRRHGFEPVIGAGASPQELHTVRDHIQQDPDAYTVQTYLPLSQAPTWNRGRIVPRAAMVRVFAMADGEGGWQILPGALTRIAHRQQQVVSMQRGGSSMDTWVITNGPVDTFSLLPDRLSPEDVMQARWPVSSRAAENLFWAGRYAERIGNDVRLARLTLTWLNGDTDNANALLRALSGLCAHSGLIPPDMALAARVFEHTLVRNLADRDGGLARNLGALAYCAGQIRDRLSPDHWRLIATMSDPDYLPGGEGDGTDPAYTAADVLPTLRRLGHQLSAIGGAQSDHMTRDDGWRLLTIGRHTERLATMARLLNAFFSSNAAQSEAGFNLLLELFDSIITYRAYYQGRQEIPALLHLLALDPANPRSLACALETLYAELPRLPDHAAGPAANLAALLPPADTGATLVELCQRDGHGRHAALLELTTRVEAAASALSDSISQRYFSHVTDSHSLSA